MNKKKTNFHFFTQILISALCFFIFQPLHAQTNLSVPVTDNVYQLLEYASLQGYIPLLPSARPYTQNFVVNQLKEIIACENLKEGESEIFEQALERIRPSEKQKWYMTGSYTNRYDEDVKLPIEAGGIWRSNFAINLNNPKFTTEQWLGFYFLGDLGEHFSYKIDANGVLMKQSESSYAPYMFDKSWDGYQFIFSDFYEYVPVSESLAGGVKLEPELSASFFDDKAQIKFSRTRHNFGYGHSSLILSQDAQPFLAVETHINPVKWFETNFIVGTLEYESNGDLKTSSSYFQNMYSMITGQFNIGDYVYFGAVSSGVWIKRFELGYLYPLLLPFLYQNQVGDFDNVQMGMYGGVTIPKVTHLYLQIFIDECNLLSKNFLHLDRNMYCFQVGAKTPIPVWFSSLTTQYTKIEPYMYTHPLTENPWYSATDSFSGLMQTAYINHGECIGYYLPPNSDEFFISFESSPLWFLHTTVSYALVRHGCTSRSKAVDGSSYTDTLDYSGDLQNAQQGDTYWKDFLHDGAYEWINYVTLSASLNCREWNIPIEVCLAYTFSYTAHSYGTADSLTFFADEEYPTAIGNYFSISIKIW